MLTAIKISGMALIAVVALPPYTHEPTMAPSDPSAISVPAMVTASTPDPSRQATATPRRWVGGAEGGRHPCSSHFASATRGGYFLARAGLASQAATRDRRQP